MTAIDPTENEVHLRIKHQITTQIYDKVIIAIGGSPKKSGLEWLEKMGCKIIDPLPSLFTFNMPKENITSLMGISVPNAIVNIQGSKLSSNGPLLITHWGMSGPAILKLSAFGARELFESNYNFQVRINWIGNKQQDDVRESIKAIFSQNSKKDIGTLKIYDLPKRLWHHFLDKCSIPISANAGEMGSKSINRITNSLTSDIYQVTGKTTFKEEFVTCGGISLKAVHAKSLASKISPHLYFCGEILDIDGITGGFNFQAAWTTAFIAAQLK